MSRVYLDHLNNATMPSEVRRAIEEAFRLFGNPSSGHGEGRASLRALQSARGHVAALLGAQPEEILFTSSGTEANALALTGLAQPHPNPPPTLPPPLAGVFIPPDKAGGREKGRGHLVVSAVEHLSILQLVRRMEAQGWQATVVPVDRFGQVHPDQVERALTDQTVLVCIQWANPEVGTLQPMGALVRRVKARASSLGGRRILFHSDAVAAAGRVKIDVQSVPVDALSLAANTFGGPPGIGALYLKKGVRISPLLVGGVQEDGRRAGTENLLGIVGMGEAARLAKEALCSSQASPLSIPRLTSLRDRLIRGILEAIPGTSLNGHPTERLPGHASFSFPGLDAEELVLALDLKGIAVGIGSACTSKTMKASHVLKAMGVAEARALSTITCTLGVETTEDEIDQVVETLPQVVTERAERGLAGGGLTAVHPALAGCPDSGRLLKER